MIRGAVISCPNDSRNKVFAYTRVSFDAQTILIFLIPATTGAAVTVPLLGRPGAIISLYSLVAGRSRGKKT
jgi:hypothetical protein